MTSFDQDRTSVYLDLALQLGQKERDTFVDLVRQADQKLGRELEGRIIQYASFERLMEDGGALPQMLQDLGSTGSEIVETARDEIKPAMPPPRIDGYHLVKRIGEGGQGSVYLARQSQPQRNVALKIMHGAAYNGFHQFHARFDREYQALARLNHPQIARFYAIGNTPEGHPYFAMEYIDGCAITRYCRRRKLGLKARLQLFGQVCAGLQHAHLKLIIHCDLKPANILVTERDGQAVVKIIDFGIAKDLGRDMSDRDDQTREGWLGTPDYMAPELLGSTKSVPDLRVDVYALSVVLYQLVTTRKPFSAPSREEVPSDEILRMLREDEPPRPSQCLRSAANRGAFRQGLPRALDRDLDWVIMKGMSKEPDHRYPTVAALWQDCAHYLANRPVSAKPPNPLYLARKFIVRNKLFASATALVLGALVFAFLATWLAKGNVDRALRRSQKSFQTLESVLTAPHELGVQARVVDVMKMAEGTLSDDLAEDPKLERMVRTVWGKTYFGLNLYERAADHFTKSLSLLRGNQGNEHPETLRLHYHLALVEMRQGNYAGAHDRLAQTYRLQRKHHGLGPATLETLAFLATVLHFQNRDEEAEDLLEEVVAVVAKMPAGPAKAQYLVTRAILRNARGDHSAEALLREAYAIQTGALGSDHPNTLATMSNLANHYRSRGNHAASEALYRKIIQLREDKLGDEHDRTLAARHGLALCLLDQQRYDEAEAMIRDTWQRLRQKGEAHPDTFAAMRLLANVFRRSGQFDKAAKLLGEMIDLYERHGLGHSPGVLMAKTNLGDLLIGQQKFGEALPLLAETQETMSLRLGAGDPNTVAALITLGQARQGLGDHKTAEYDYLRAIALLARHHPRSRELPFYRAIRAHNLARIGRFDEAERLLLQCLEDAGERHLYRREILDYLVRHYRECGDETQAERFDCIRSGD